MNDNQMWAVYGDDGCMVQIESKKAKNGVATDKIIARRPCICGHITEVGKMLDEVIEMAGPKRKDEYYVVRGTFIPEEKL